MSEVGDSTPARTVVVWCPDWPVVAAAAAESLPPQVPVAVLAAGAVVGPALFEPVVAAVEALAPGVEVVRPGLVALAARGPTHYFGSEQAVAERIVDVVAAEAGVECQVGVADGLFAAMLAAHQGLLVPPGDSAAFLAPLGITELHQPADRQVPSARADFVDLLRRLGLRTLGAFAALPVEAVASRFGPDGVRAHRCARGLAERPLARRNPPVELAVTQRLDPPVDRVDAAAFAVREPAERLHAALAARGLACTRLTVRAVTEHGEELTRVWRCAEPLSAAGIADRVRWQLDGWLSSRGGNRPSAGLTELHLAPQEVVGGAALQRGLWGESGEADERAGRALVRVQGLLGADAVVTGVLGGGRGPVDRARLVPWGDEQTAAHPSQPPWPGRLPAPSPSVVPPRPLPADVLDTTGAPIAVSGRQVLSAAPHRVAVEGRPPRQVLTWAGPWPVAERWWEPGGGRRRARLQVVVDVEPHHLGEVLPGEPGELALLLACEAGRWQVEGVYE